jgi:Do/DeqQ family serine protease
MRHGRLIIAIAASACVGLAIPFPRGGMAGPERPALRPVQAGQAPAQPAPVLPLGPETQVAVPSDREAIRLSFAPIVRRVAPAVVNVYATARAEARSPFAGDPFFERFFGGDGFFGAPRERARSSLGSGVIVDPTGVVVTNHHVISGATEVKVALADGREFQAEILIRDERTDLAVLKIANGTDGFPALEIGDSDALEVGDLVLALGNPFGVGQTVTSGIVSAVARTNVGVSDSAFFIQTDAAINPGNSGGALVDMNGALVGVNTAIFSRSGGSIGIGFAIPSNMVQAIVAQALAGSTSVARPWIGVLCQEVSPEIATSLGIAAPRGALVTQIDPESPADRAGLRVGDLIMRVGDREVGNPAALDYRLAVAGIGQELMLEIWRDGKAIALSVTPEAEPELDESDLTVLGGRSPLTGATVADLTASLAERLDVRAAGRGAVIVDVAPLSPAARLGFRPGDVVLRAQGEDVENSQQLAELMETRSRVWRITLNRGGRVSNVVIGG